MKVLVLRLVWLAALFQLTLGVSRELFQELDEDVDEASALAPDSEPPCMPEDGWWRPGSTYNDPTELITDTAEECCQICRDEERCLTWSRHRASGACALKDTNATAVLDDRYDSGFIGGVNVLEVVELAACFVESRLAYPRGDVLEETVTESVQECCQICRDNVDCFSWYRSLRSTRCVLNRNVPRGRRRGVNFSGASII